MCVHLGLSLASSQELSLRRGLNIGTRFGMWSYRTKVRGLTRITGIWRKESHSITELVTTVSNRGSVLLETLQETVQHDLQSHPPATWKWGAFLLWFLNPLTKGCPSGDFPQLCVFTLLSRTPLMFRVAGGTEALRQKARDMQTAEVT